MRERSLAELSEARRVYDGRVAGTPWIDRFCASSAWIIPAREAFARRARDFILEGEHGWVPLMAQEGHHGLTLLPLEAVWGMATPLVGHDPELLVAELDAALAQTDLPWKALYLCGIDPGGPVLNRLKRSLGKRYRLGLGNVTRRMKASLEGGLDGFLSRRSPGFRAKARRALRGLEENGLTFEDHRPTDAASLDPLMDRILAVESRSWKGAGSIGIDSGSMELFYRRMNELLAEDGNLLISVLRREERDVAYVFGGLFGRTYRGLQISYDEEFAELSPGNVAQIHMIERLCALDVSTYDLGMAMPYKERWSEIRHDTVMLAALRS